MVRRAREFVDRTPITGAEAMDMVQVQQWLDGLANVILQAQTSASGSPPTPSQVADTSGK